MTHKANGPAMMGTVARTPDHYFASQPASPSRPGTVRVALAGAGSFTLRTDRGVFAQGRLDPGTRLLLERAPAPPASGDLADVGCGSGIIALALARRSPACKVWAIDVNERALALCRTNAEANGLANVVTARPEDVPPELRLAAWWSNPPIHIGKPALHEVLLTWLGRLRPPDGATTPAAVMVVHQHLGSDSLQRWLGEAGWPAERLASAHGYRVLRVSRPGRVDLDPQP